MALTSFAALHRDPTVALRPQCLRSAESGPTACAAFAPTPWGRAQRWPEGLPRLSGSSRPKPRFPWAQDKSPKRRRHSPQPRHFQFNSYQRLLHKR